MTITVRDFLAHLPAGRRQLTWLAYYTRRGMARVDNAEVRAGRQLIHMMRTSPPDVLFLGDSAVSFVGSSDADRRRLFEMVGDQLGAGVTMHTVHGGSYHAALYDAYLRLLTCSTSRPLVIVPLCNRVRTVPWIEHPTFGHKQATAYLDSLDLASPRWRIRSGLPRPSADDFRRFHALPHHTWVGELTIGDYVTRLKNPQAAGLDELSRMKLLYAYHHGGAVQTGVHLQAVERMGRRIKDLGCAPVVYQTPVPVQKGYELFGSAFSQLAADNFAQLDGAFSKGYGEGARVLQTGVSFATDEFIDPRDGSEHLNEKGRTHLAAEITAEVQSKLEP